MKETIAKKNSSVWEVIKFIFVSSLVGVLQLVLANILPFVFDGVRIPIPEFLQGIFVPGVIFNCETAKGASDYAKYVINGVVTWGYVLPFFLSNVLANIYGYFQNRKTTFKSKPSTISFIAYVIIIFALILFSTWLQGIIVGKLNSTGIGWVIALSRTIASAVAGTIQALILFPLEKYVLMRKKDDNSIDTKNVKC